MVGEAGRREPVAAKGNAVAATPPRRRRQRPRAVSRRRQRQRNAGAGAARGTLGTLPPRRHAAPVMAGRAYSRARELLVERAATPRLKSRSAISYSTTRNADTPPMRGSGSAFTLLARNNYQDAAASFVQYLQRHPAGPARARSASAPRHGARRHGPAPARLARRSAALSRRYPNAPRNVRDLATREVARGAVRGLTPTMLDRRRPSSACAASGDTAPILVALSGGGDSVALLHLVVGNPWRCRACARSWSITACARVRRTTRGARWAIAAALGVAGEILSA